MLLNAFDNLRRFRRGNITGAVIHHCFVPVVFLVGKGYEISAENNVRVLHIDADTYGFKGGTSRVAVLGIVAENTHICNIAAGLQALCNGFNCTNFSVTCKFIKQGFVCTFHGGFAVEGGDGIIRHSVI